MDIYGEKYSGDSKFVADCRQLQAMYRVEVNEAIRPYKGRDGKTHYYGNYISGGEKSGKNFLTKYAFRYAQERIAKKNKAKHRNKCPCKPVGIRIFYKLSKAFKRKISCLGNNCPYAKRRDYYKNNSPQNTVFSTKAFAFLCICSVTRRIFLRICQNYSPFRSF